VTPSFPKPRPRLVDRVQYKRDREVKARAFRLAVWLRDGGICQYCERHVKHSIEAIPQRGEVHHLAGRNVRPQDRFVVARAILLCLACHQRATRHEIRVTR
jgi:5-methylcytosine-specific restriction endonuclease McrA